MKLRIATFNLENLDNVEGEKPALEERAKILVPQLKRLDADIICFQEIHGQEKEDDQRDLAALKEILVQTQYRDYHISTTETEKGAESERLQVFDKRNLVTVSKFGITNSWQIRNEIVEPPEYKAVTNNSEENKAKEVVWERPILYSKILLPDGKELNLLNLHLKSKRPTDIRNQKIDRYTWKTASGWAEGFFLSAMKRVGQALETRTLVDQLFDSDPNSMIVVAGDLNADIDEVATEAILGRVENTGNTELSERELIPCELSVPETSRYTLFHQGKKLMIDHILISRSLLEFYSHTEIHNEVLADESVNYASDIKFPGSDHAAVIAEFRI